MRRPTPNVTRDPYESEYSIFNYPSLFQRDHLWIVTSKDKDNRNSDVFSVFDVIKLVILP